MESSLARTAVFVEEKCADYMANHKPVHRPELESEEDFTIVYNYQARYRGYVQFYKLATNLLGSTVSNGSWKPHF